LRFLIDNALSPLVAEALRGAGHEAVHVRELGLQAASDAVIFDHAAAEQFVIVSADTDFGTLLALREAPFPSVILFRGTVTRRPKEQVSLLLNNLPEFADALDIGSVVVVEAQRIRIRTLPISTST
jgi:predicted nuclease of predicted toxin-antitoxin system